VCVASFVAAQPLELRGEAVASKSEAMRRLEALSVVTAGGLLAILSSLPLALAAQPAAASEPNAPTQAPAGPLDSVTLLSQKPILVSRHGVAKVQLGCSGGRNCHGTLSLERARSAKKLAKVLGRKQFSLPPQQSHTVEVRLSRPSARWARKAAKASIVATVKERDVAGRLRTSAMETTLVSGRPR
jgi:hypothetical protein